MPTLYRSLLVASSLVFAVFTVASAGSTSKRPMLSPELSSSLHFVEEQPLFPDYAFQELTAVGERRDLGFVELRGSVVVAVFWATWCSICAVEIPKLDRLQAALGKEGLLVVTLSQDDDAAEARRYFQQRNVRNLRVFHDTDSVNFAMLGLTGVPTAFVVDKRGRIVAAGEGRIPWDSAEARALLRFYLAQNDSSS